VGVQGPTDNSNNFGNWATADSKINGITATSFGIYVFEINAPLGPNDTVSIQFSSIPLGAFAIGYGQNSPDANHTYVFDTPFTQAGLTTGSPPPPPTAPVPSSIMLLCSGGIAAVFFGLRRLRRPQVVVA
jgi:hypothetical protein